MAPSLLACPACNHHAKSAEPTCPKCGARLRVEGAVPRTAMAVLLGLAATATACGGSVDSRASGGAGSTTTSHTGHATGSTARSTSGTGGSGGAGGASSTAKTSTVQTTAYAAAYGIAVTGVGAGGAPDGQGGAKP